jgi:hypothetical protein
VSTADDPVFSIEVSTFVWQGFMQEVTAKWEITGFERPAEGLSQVAIDPHTGLLPGPGADSVEEWFISGTQPNAALPENTCGPDVLGAWHERNFPTWVDADREWISRAERGVGRRGGPDNNRTAYFYNNGFNPHGRTWGPVVADEACGEPSPSPSCFVVPTPDPSGVIPSFEVPLPSGSGPLAEPCPTPSPSIEPSPSEEPSEEPTPTPEPTPEPTPTPTPTPTPEPTPTPTPEESAPPPAP